MTDFSCSVAVGQAWMQAPQTDALAVHERFVLAGCDPAGEAATVHRQRERSLRLLAGAHAAVADDALGRVVAEVRIAVVGLVVEVMGSGRGANAIADFTQADDPGLGLQLAVAVGAAGQAVERVIGDVELHHALAQLLQPL